MARSRRKEAASQSASQLTEQRETLEDFLNRENSQDLLRFITCGSVDDGKSTLIGRLLWESQLLFEDQLAALRVESNRFGTQDQGIDFALLVDGLAAEREQGITIDVAYRFFATKRRKFIVADTPGHEQYTRNMITGASTADVALLLVDARHGVQVQTRRHAYLASLMGIRQVVLVVNKLDLLDFDQQVFLKISDEFRKFSTKLAFDTVTPIPISALQGDNIVARSPRTPWYVGPTLMGYLETVDHLANAQSDRFVFPVQWVNRPDLNFRGFSGTVVEGRVSIGDEIRLPRNGQMATIKDIVTFDGALAEAGTGDAITLVLDREIDISRGDVISESHHPIETTDQFEATLVWLAEEPGLIGRNYEIKLATQTAAASITAIKYKLDVNTLAHEASTQLSLNDICSCNLSLGKPLAYDAYLASKTLGGFILIDRFSNATVAAGMIKHSLRRSQNIHRQDLAVTIAERERLNGHKAQVIWFTGLSGSGKSTLANALEVALHAQGLRTYILDGDNIRHGLNKDLGFTDADRVENIRRVAEVAKLMVDAGLIVMTAFISPFRQEREMARELIGEDRFIEVFVDTPLEICEQRDPKGLYKKARLGQIPNMTGINSVYETPVSPNIVIGHQDNKPLSEAVGDLVRALES
ncbi:adenylyl-sulfate kinase [Acidihalobacter aeolianus]|uniref:Multifunctional fusion protein n=1 Tax=Acidihalobacter aeolianus TaxID=2792603 RepID=A0A1D8K799_9GAMM|nr:sulfate adenylyltransferase subunit CysN [Acidihalobacter aeolianus]AOV16844.1 adenylyl-sulfate kinase [Acidihalobacter aeolianus]